MAEQKPKTQDTKRDENVADPQLVAGADQALQDARGNVFGDNTSSSAEANNPGQHGRDGGEINGVTNNPEPSKEAQLGEAADDNKKEA